MLIAIDPRDPRPIYEQIVAAVKEQIQQGLLEPGDELPSVRELAQTLGINANTAHRAYQRLHDDGAITSRLGQRARVATQRRRAHDDEIERKVISPLGAVVVEALHLGMTPQEVLTLTNDLLKRLGGTTR